MIVFGSKVNHAFAQPLGIWILFLLIEEISNDVCLRYVGEFFLKSITLISLDRRDSDLSISDNFAQASDGFFSGNFISTPLLRETSHLLLPI